MSASASLIPTRRCQTLRGKLVVDFRLSSPGKGRRTGMAQGPAGSLGGFTVLSVIPANLGMRPALGNARFAGRALGFRSEGHTSETQSLMRISFAVFRLQ